MRAFAVAFMVAAFASALLTPLVRRFAFYVGAVSVPGGRHVHRATIPRLGGLSIFVGFFIPVIGAYLVQSSVASVVREHALQTVGFLVGGSSVCLLGVLDDTRRVRALYKLYVQIGVAVLAYLCGFRIDAVRIPFVGDLLMGVFSLPVTVFWIVGIINAINLIDGLDGLAGGVVFFAGITNFAVAYLSGSILVAFVMASMLGAVLGFLLYNFNPARIFMGDSGSYFLGFILAVTSLVGSVQKESTAISILVPIIALGVPIFDTLFAMVRRFMERRPLFSPDRGHIHHRLLDMGITHRRAVLILYGVSITFTVAAIGIAIDRSWPAGLAILAASVVAIGLVRFVGYFEYLHGLRRQKARLRSRHTELLRYVMPELPTMFMEAQSEEDIWGVLRMIIRRADLYAIELLEPADCVTAARIRWGHALRSNAAAGTGGSTAVGLQAIHEAELVSARYPIGREDVARATLKFIWKSEEGDVPPQSEVLLQVITDIVARELVRVGSAFAPIVYERRAVSLGPASRPSVDAVL